MGLRCPLHFNRHRRAVGGRKGGSVKDDQQPAFPTWKRSEDMAEGMSLRDYFAAAALQGFLANPNRKATPTQWAEDAYLMANVMLKARSA